MGERRGREARERDMKGDEIGHAYIDRDGSVMMTRSYCTGYII